MKIDKQECIDALLELSSFACINCDGTTKCSECIVRKLKLIVLKGLEAIKDEN